jgi:hypothetical protein
MSRYHKARMYSIWVLIAFVTSLFWLPYLTRTYGVAGTLAGGVIWLSHGIPSLLFFRCPACDASIFSRFGRVSLFRTDKISWPPQQIWPNKRCANCGEDHTVS